MSKPFFEIAVLVHNASDGKDSVEIPSKVPGGPDYVLAKFDGPNSEGKAVNFWKRFNRAATKRILELLSEGEPS